jgi:transposase
VVQDVSAGRSLIGALGRSALLPVDTPWTAGPRRTHGGRWRSLQPDSPATIRLRTHERARKDLVQTPVAVANQLRAHLRIVFPGARGSTDIA